MKNARNTSRQFRAIARIRAKFEAQRGRAVCDRRIAQAAMRYGAALLAAGVTAGNVLAVLRSIWRDAHCRPPRISAYMTARQAARHEKREEWKYAREVRQYNRAERLWEKYGRDCPYGGAW